MQFLSPLSSLLSPLSALSSLCSLLSPLCSLLSALCSLLSPLCSLLSALCSLLFNYGRRACRRQLSEQAGKQAGKAASWKENKQFIEIAPECSNYRDTNNRSVASEEQQEQQQPAQVTGISGLMLLGESRDIPNEIQTGPVSGWPTPLKNMTSSVEVIIPNILEKRKNVPNHQPANILWKK